MSEPKTHKFEVKFDERIIRDEKLFAAVEAATRYFIEQYEPRGEGQPVADPSVDWSIHPGSLTPVSVTVAEHSPFDGQEVYQAMSMSEILGERERNVRMLRLWRRLLELRSAKRISIMEKLLREVEDQEGGAGRGISNAH